MSKQVFFYRVKINRTSGPATREGTIVTKYPTDALDDILKMAVDVWKTPLIKIELYEIDKNGALVATTTVGEKVDRVLESHKRLRPNTVAARLAEQRDKRKEKAKEEVKKSPTPNTNTWDWNLKVGTRYSEESFKMPQTWSA